MSTVTTGEAVLSLAEAVCAFAGLRRGEASALRVSDVDFPCKEIHVLRQVQWTDDG